MPTKTRPMGRVCTRSTLTVKVNGTTTPGSTTQTKTWVDTVTGGTNPRWRSQIARGTQAGTTLVGSSESYRPLSFDVVETFDWVDPTPPGTANASKSHSGRLMLDVDNYITGTTPSETIANNLALQHFVSKVRSKQSSIQGGVFLGELGQTVRMLRHPLGALRSGFPKYLASLKRRKLTKGRPEVVRRQRKRILSETWLEYSFGWAPLFSDIDSIIDTLVVPLPEHRETCWGVGVQRYASHGTTTFGSTPPQVVVGWKQTKTVTVKYYGMLAIDQPSQFSQKRLGLDLSSFVPTAWEVLPWSFLVDYFTNIGHIVSAATLARQDLRWTMKTVITEISRRSTGIRFSQDSVDPSLGSVDVSGYAPGWAESKKRTVSRIPYYDSLVPTLYVKAPGTNLKLLNILALSRTARGLTPYY